MPTPKISLDALLRPQSVAIIGASTTEHKVGGVPVALLKKLGYQGRIVPVHPEAKEIQGLPAVARIADAGEAIDLAIVCVPERAAAQVFAECAAAKVKAAIMFTSGFAEMGEAGAAAQSVIAKIAADAGIILLGPNCLGAMSLKTRLFATFSPAPFGGVPPLGSIGLVSQSGAFGAYAYTLARKGSLGLSHWVTTGNEAGVQAADVIEWLAYDDETRVILAYLEGCRDGPRLKRALDAARAAGKPVVITKVGRTAAGARAAMSHTASLAGEDAVYAAVFDECAAIRAYTIEEFFRYGQVFATSPRPATSAVAIVTLSGGVGTLMADRAEELGLELPPFTDDEAAPLKRAVPFCSTINPIDVTGQIIGQPGVMPLACESAAASGRYGAVALFTAAGAVSPVFWPSMLKSAQILTAHKGVAAAVSGVVTDEQKRALMELGCLVYEEPTHAIEAFAIMRRYAKACELAAQQVAQPAAIRAAQAAASLASFVPPASAAGGIMVLPRAGALNEAEGLAFLQSGGVRAAPFAVAKSAEEAARIAADFAAPVAIKVLSRDLLHKSDIGGVKLGVRGADAARAAFDEIFANVARMAPGAAFEGVIVARMVTPVIECMAGARFDPVFGPVIAFGLGGTEVEWLKRVVIATAPVSPARVAMLLGKLGILERLNGWRGGPTIDPDGLIQAVCGVSALAAAAAERLVSIEVNPLMVTADGVFAADAVVQLGA